MKKRCNLNIGLSDYAISAYLSLIGNHPVNGSQLSRQSGIPRARIYDILRTLKQKGFVAELTKGVYTPLPPDELIKRLRHEHERDLAVFESLIEDARAEVSHEFIWTIKGYDNVIAKAVEMIASAREEIYVRLFPDEGRHLDSHLLTAEARGIQVKYISMRPPRHPSAFKLQVFHPEVDQIENALGGRTFDMVVDREEIIGGMFEKGKDDIASINWGKNPWFVLAARDSLRHDFFHYFLHKVYSLKEDLTDKEKHLYSLIVKDT